MVDPGRLKEAAAFERIRLLCFFYFCDSKVSGPWIRMDDLKGLPIKEPLGRAIDIQVKSAPTSRPTER